MMKQDIKIVAQEEGWMCVEKPSGISVHNEPGKDLISLLSARLEPEGILQPVHRLDKETSGLLLLALDHPTLTRLSELFAQGKVKKRYKALVHGNFEPDQPRGTWDTPLSKQAGGRTDPKGKGKKQEAVTRYRVLEQSPHYALLDIELLTGRKHQIRRHAKLNRHPVVGDKRYGSPRSIVFLKEQRQFFGMALQSCYLEFKDKNRTIALELPDLPPDMDRLLNEDE